jgi:hypothetical protein
MEDDSKSRRCILNLLITRRGGSHKRPVAKFLVPDCGCIVNPRPEFDYISQSGTKNLASEAQFIVSDWGDIVGSGIELSYLPDKLHRLAGRYDNPMPESTILSPSQGLRNQFKK